MNFPSLGILLINLGTPEAPTVPAVRAYLREFLSDPLVIDLPAIFRWLLLNIFILPTRPKQSAHAYQKIWTEQGSPLLVNSQELATEVQKQLGDVYQVSLAMRYGEPNIREALKNFQKKNISRLIVIPLFPQYSMAATGSAIAETKKQLKKLAYSPELKIIQHFYEHPEFINSFAEIIQQHIAQKNIEKVIFSYHGLPVRQLKASECQRLSCDQNQPCPLQKKSDCYRQQCYQTSDLLAKQIGLSKDQYEVAFQSRLGRTPWIQPYLDESLVKLAQQGIRRIAVVCPAFVADCLETLEEIGIRASAQWRSLGGEELLLVPCLNAHPAWVENLVKMIKLAVS